ncbi:MAG TPA: hypothetical protein VGF75_03155 [Candidatus Saccharimonadales bacterium]
MSNYPKLEVGRTLKDHGFRVDQFDRDKLVEAWAELGMPDEAIETSTLRLAHGGLRERKAGTHSLKDNSITLYVNRARPRSAYADVWSASTLDGLSTVLNSELAYQSSFLAAEVAVHEEFGDRLSTVKKDRSDFVGTWHLFALMAAGLGELEAYKLYGPTKELIGGVVGGVAATAGIVGGVMIIGHEVKRQYKYELADRTIANIFRGGPDDFDLFDDILTVDPGVTQPEPSYLTIDNMAHMATSPLGSLMA